MFAFIGEALSTILVFLGVSLPTIGSIGATLVSIDLIAAGRKAILFIGGVGVFLLIFTAMVAALSALITATFTLMPPLPYHLQAAMRFIVPQNASTYIGTMVAAFAGRDGFNFMKMRLTWLMSQG